MKIIIKPFSEIMVKSKPVRKKYLKILQNNINLRIKKIHPDFKCRVFWDKLEINCEEKHDIYKNDIKIILKRMPGVETFLDVQKYEVGDLESIANKAYDVYSDQIKTKTFVVRAKRSGIHDFTSIELERFVGAFLLKKLDSLGIHGRVSLKNPEVTVLLEIKDNALFVVETKNSGIGGYPVGTQDKILSLISGGFDSGVSTYSMMKRGCKVDFLFFNLGGSAHELGVKQVSQYLNEQFSSGYKANIISIPFEGVVKELLLNVNHRFRGIILKRCMLKVADILAQKNEYLAIVKGDSLGQVSSQTLKNMFAIDKACDTLVLRPLISFNKQEIIDISQEIGTYSYAVNMPEYCGVISDKPATGASLKQVLEAEEKFDMSVLDQAIEDKKVEYVKDIQIDGDSEEIETINFPQVGEIIIDVREELDFKDTPLQIESNEIMNIPFFDINFEFENLDQSKEYLFYCDKGILSKLHGLYLKEKGFKNIKVLRIIEKDKVCGIL